eukprot:8263137-Alexandrium_andersonii.AAC.1
MSQSLREEISIGATDLGGGRGVRRLQRWRGAVCWEWDLGVESCIGHPVLCRPCVGHACSGPSVFLSLSSGASCSGSSCLGPAG